MHKYTSFPFENFISFSINRKYLVAIDAITDMHVYSNSRLKIKVKQQEEDDFLVAREKVKAFKDWIEGNQGSL